MSSPRNAEVVKRVAAAAPKALATAINQGDRLILTAGLVLAQSDGNTDWVGVADDTDPNAVGASTGEKTAIRVLGTGTVVNFYCVSGTVTFGDPLYCEAAADTVTKTSSSRKLCGYARNLTAIVCTTGSLVPVEIKPTDAAAL